ncbi:hypothetical protein C8R44DRAFT_616324 [Mycena epipterygia]|nr:hypothetical protein C8R44DRAFT_616324 [Mycena epipterygia]
MRVCALLPPNTQSSIFAATHPALNRFLLPSQEYVTCALWNGLYHITGADIVRVLLFRFEVRCSAFGFFLGRGYGT